MTGLRVIPLGRPPFPLPSRFRIQCSRDFGWAPTMLLLTLT